MELATNEVIALASGVVGAEVGLVHGAAASEVPGQWLVEMFVESLAWPVEILVESLPWPVEMLVERLAWPVWICWPVDSGDAGGVLGLASRHWICWALLLSARGRKSNYSPPCLLPCRLSTITFIQTFSQSYLIPITFIPIISCDQL